jgi:hypothetical protein
MRTDGCKKKPTARLVRHVSNVPYRAVLRRMEYGRHLNLETSGFLAVRLA